MATYSDILFGKIVIKNGLAPAASVQECLQIQETSRARGVTMTLPEILIARAVISEEQARLAQRAQALTQFQRAEAIYARIANEKLGIAVPTLQQCFEVQRQRQWKVRIAQILLERKMITAEQNDEIADEQIVRLAEETRGIEEAGLGVPAHVAAAPPASRPLSQSSQGQGDSWRQKGGARPPVAAPPPGRDLTGSSRGGAPPPPREEPGFLGTRTVEVDAPPPAPPGGGGFSGTRTVELDVPSNAPGMGVPVAIPMEDLASMSVRGGRFSLEIGKGGGASAQDSSKGGDPNSLIGKTISSRYRILEKIGEGGMGTVYKAEHCLMEKVVAFKVLHPHLITNKESLERFRREVRAASRFQHKNVVQIYDAGEGEGGIFYMAMEFVEGTHLEDILKQGNLGLERTLTILRQTLKAIGEAHKKGIVHRDMKSENIMITKGKHGDDVVKVMDFGIAKLTEGDSHSDSQGGDGDRVYKTMEGVVTGTPQYMSPEQASGEKVDHRSDLYSLGVIIFEMITNQLPFSSNTPMGFLGKHIVEPPPLPSAVCTEKGLPVPPPNLEKIVMRLLEKKPEDRYQTAGEIADDLDATVTKELFDVSPGSGSMSTERITPKKGAEKPGLPLLPILVVGGAAIVAAVTIVIAFLVIFGGPNPAQLRTEVVKKAEALIDKDALDQAEDEVQKVVKVHGHGEGTKEALQKIADRRKDRTLAAEEAKAEREAEVLRGEKKLDEALARWKEARQKAEALPALQPRVEAIDAKIKELEAEIKKRDREKEARDKVGRAKEYRKSGQFAQAKDLLDEAERVLKDDREIALERGRVEADELVRAAEELRAQDAVAAATTLEKAIRRHPDDDARKALEEKRQSWLKDAEREKVRQELDRKLGEARDKLVALDVPGAEAVLKQLDAQALGLGEEDQRRIAARRETAQALAAGLAKDLATALDAVDKLMEKSQKDPLKTKRDDVVAATRKIEDQRERLAGLKDGDVRAKLLARLGQDLDRLRVLENSLKGNQQQALGTAVRIFAEAVEKLKGRVPDLEKARRVNDLLKELYNLADSSPYRDPSQAEAKAWIDAQIKKFTAMKPLVDELPPSDWVKVKGGEYTVVGTKKKEKLPETYYVCDHEVTCAEWDVYMRANALAAPTPDWEPIDRAVTNITFEEAQAYARWRTGKLKLVTLRLPSEAEWERAARGDAGTDYPWGDTWKEGKAAGDHEVSGVQKVRSFSTVKNDLGLYDTCGNAAEMTTTLEGEKLVTKGGSVLSNREGARASKRNVVTKTTKDIATGFRLVAVEKK